jgi:hypothetical protein
MVTTISFEAAAACSKLLWLRKLGPLIRNSLCAARRIHLQTYKDDWIRMTNGRQG